jgi:hypothetical protein
MHFGEKLAIRPKKDFQVESGSCQYVFELMAGACELRCNSTSGTKLLNS